MRSRLLRGFAFLVALLFVGCGDTTSTVVPEEAAKTVVRVVDEQTDFRPTDVECPSGVEAEVEGTFDCHFTGPEGPYVAHMKILDVEGERVDFRIVTRPER